MLETFGPFLLEAGVLVLAALAAIYIYIKSSFSYWTKLGIPVYKPVVPFGNFGPMIMKNTGVLPEITKLYKAFEGHRLGGLYGFGYKFLLVRDPDLIRDIIVKDFIHFHDRGVFLSGGGDPLDLHLFSMTGAKWRKLRVKLTPTFTSGKMKMMFGTLVECGKGLNAVLQKPAKMGETLEVKDILARFSTDVIASCAFGIQCNCLRNPNAEFRTWGRKVFEITFKTKFFRLLNIIIPGFIKYFGLSLIPSDVSNYFRKMVRETVDYRERNGIQRNDFMHLLIQLKNKTMTTTDEDAFKCGHSELDAEDSKEFEITMDVIAAQAFVFFIAGFETSSTTMTFCLYELALNPDIQERLRAEIDTVLEKHDGNITYESISEMEYLDKVVSETLRKYPPVQALVRMCTKPYRIPGTNATLEKGIRVFVPIMGLHHDQKYYPDPERFDPERFSDKEKSKRPQYSYLPFGEGPRICIGMRFGLMQTKVGLVSLLSNYEFQVSEKTPEKVVMDPRSFILSPLGGLYLKITDRSDRM